MARRKALTSLAILTLLLPLLSIFTVPPPTAAQGEYRCAITITNNVAQDLTDYAVRIELDSTWEGWQYAPASTTVYFLNESGCPIYYWIQEWDTTAKHAIVWVKVPFIPAGASTVIYMYFGGGTNPYASYLSPYNVFLFFDDFAGTDVDTAHWTIIGIASGYTAYEVSDSKLHLYVGLYGLTPVYTGGPVAILITPTVGAGYEFRTMVKAHSAIDASVSYLQAVLGVALTTSTTSFSNTDVYRAYGFRSDGSIEITAPSSATTVYQYGSWSGESGWTEFGIRLLSSQIVYLLNGTVIYTESVQVTSTYYAALPCKGGDGDTYDYWGEDWYEWFFIRRVVDPEPSVDIGPVEELSTGGGSTADMTAAERDRYIVIAQTMNIAPNDTIAPHLYDWVFDGVDDYIDVPDFDFSVLGNGFTLQMYLTRPRKTNECDILRRATSDTGVGYFVIEYLPSYESYHLITRDSANNEYMVVTTGTGTIADDAFHHIAFVWNVSAFTTYVDGAHVLSKADTRTSKGMDFTGLMICKKMFTDYADAKVAYVVIHARPLADLEIRRTYTDHIVTASNLVLFLDPTFWNETSNCYVDLGSGLQAIPYGGVVRVVAGEMWLWLVKGLAADNQVHLRFFPPGTIVNFTASDGTTYTVTIGESGCAALSLPAGEYEVKAYIPADELPHVDVVYETGGRPAASDLAVYYILKDGSEAGYNPPATNPVLAPGDAPPEEIAYVKVVSRSAGWERVVPFSGFPMTVYVPGGTVYAYRIYIKDNTGKYQGGKIRIIARINGTDVVVDERGWAYPVSVWLTYGRSYGIQLVSPSGALSSVVWITADFEFEKYVEIGISSASGNVKPKVIYPYQEKPKVITVPAPPQSIFEVPTSVTAGGIITLGIVLAMTIALARAEYDPDLGAILASAFMIVFGILAQNKGVIGMAAVCLTVALVYRIARRRWEYGP